MGGNVDYIGKTELFSRVPSSLFNTSLSQSVSHCVSEASAGMKSY